MSPKWLLVDALLFVSLLQVWHLFVPQCELVAQAAQRVWVLCELDGH